MANKLANFAVEAKALPAVSLPSLTEVTVPLKEIQTKKTDKCVSCSSLEPGILIQGTLPSDTYAKNSFEVDWLRCMH